MAGSQLLRKAAANMDKVEANLVEVDEAVQLAFEDMAEITDVAGPSGDSRQVEGKHKAHEAQKKKIRKEHMLQRQGSKTNMAVGAAEVEDAVAGGDGSAAGTRGGGAGRPEAGLDQARKKLEKKAEEAQRWLKEEKQKVKAARENVQKEHSLSADASAKVESLKLEVSCAKRPGLVAGLAN